MLVEGRGNEHKKQANLTPRCERLMGTGEGVVTLPKVARNGTIEITFEWALHQVEGSSRHL